MQTEDLKKVIKALDPNSIKLDGYYLIPLETPEFYSQVTAQFYKSKLHSLKGSFESKISGMQSTFQITQEEIDELVRAMDQMSPVKSDTCWSHKWEIYEGVIHKDYYCAKCNVTKKWDWTD